MRKQYDDFTQLKLKDMSKTISDMTYKYINPKTQAPTVVPPGHYEKILDQVTEIYIGEITSRKFLTIMYEQLQALKKEDEKYFYQALLCMDMGINPKDLRINEQIAIAYTYDFMCNKQKEEKKDFHFLNQDIAEAYQESKANQDLQAYAVRNSNMLEEQENNNVNRNRHPDRDDR